MVQIDELIDDSFIRYVVCFFFNSLALRVLFVLVCYCEKKKTGDLDAVSGQADVAASRSVVDGASNDSNDESVNSQGFRKDEDQNHSHVNFLLSSVSTDSRISSDSNGHSGSNRAESGAKSGSQMRESLVGAVGGFDC